MPKVSPDAFNSTLGSPEKAQPKKRNFVIMTRDQMTPDMIKNMKKNGKLIEMNFKASQFTSKEDVIKQIKEQMSKFPEIENCIDLTKEKIDEKKKEEAVVEDDSSQIGIQTMRR